MPFGLIDSHYISFAEGQSESRLRNMTNRLGISVSEFVNRLDGALDALNGNPDPLVSALTYRTNQERVIGGFAANKVLQRGGEYGQNRPQRGAGGGWYLPLYYNTLALGFTERALQTMTVDAFEAEVASTVQGFARGQRADVLERLFLDTVWPLDDDGAGTSPGFAGSGTGSDVYTGPVPPGVANAAALNLYSRVAAASLAAEIKTRQTQLQYFHGPGPLDLLTSSDLLDDIVALDGFVHAEQLLVQPGLGDTTARVDPTTYVGVLYGNIRVMHADNQLSGNGLAIFKSYGANAPQNPLAWRYSDIWGPDVFVEDRALFPLANAEACQWFGIGANNRVGAALIAVGGSGTYAANTVTVSR